MQYIAYVRKSTDDKKNQIQSIPNQLAWVQETAKKLDMKIIKTFSDKKTANKPGREGFNAMMEFINRLSEPVGILVWEVPRLARNAYDGGVFMQAFTEGKIPHIYAMDKQFNKGDNVILLAIEFGLSTQFSIDLSRNVTFGMKRKIKDGYRPTTSPLGYLNDPHSKKGTRKIYPDPKRFSIMQEAWKKLLTGAYSVEMIRRDLNKLGITTKKGYPIRRNTLHRIFANPFYSGYFLWNGEMYKGKHPPMITLAEFDQAQDILQQKGKAQIGKKESTYNGLLTCGECSYKVTTEYHTKQIKATGKTKTYCYLRCSKSSRLITCSQKYLREEALEKQIETELSKMQLPQVFIDWFFDHHRRKEKDNMQTFAIQRGKIQKEINANEAMKKRLVDNLNSEIVDRTTYEETMKRYKKKTIMLKKKLLRIEERQTGWIDEAYEDFCFASSARKCFAEGGRNTKREILARIGSNWILKDQKLLLDLKESFQVVVKAHNLQREHLPRLELEKWLSGISYYVPGVGECSVWCSLWDEVRTVYCS